VTASPSLALVAMAVFVLAGVAQAVTGFGLALAAMPLLTVVVAPAQAVVTTVVVGAFVAAVGWRQHADEVDGRVVRRLTAWAVPGLPVGVLALAMLPARSLTVLIAVTVLALVAATAAGVRLPSGLRAQRAAGFVSGALLTSTAMNGPPLVLVLQNGNHSPRAFRATLQAVFCLNELMALVAFVVVGALDPTVLVSSAGGLVGVYAGWWLGGLVFDRISEETFRRGVLLMLVGVSIVAMGNVLA
jgi:uncharacterized membrane protein YfcA